MNKLLLKITEKKRCFIFGVLIYFSLLVLYDLIFHDDLIFTNKKITDFIVKYVLVAFEGLALWFMVRIVLHVNIKLNLVSARAIDIFSLFVIFFFFSMSIIMFFYYLKEFTVGTFVCPLISLSVICVNSTRLQTKHLDD